MVKVAGYTTAQVCKLLRRQRQALYRSGILGKNEVIPREFPFGNSFPLYNEKVVDKWAAAMRRYD
ncbi:MAG: hypothetical protein JXB85_02100, partial [Anaerolineales bacterium]|nr:hypothetical protein [Anaerolineales bacterium]